ncbi:MAG: hypothetical protein AB8I08_33800 [Sandaracinaceae bacterium]
MNSLPVSSSRQVAGRGFSLRREAHRLVGVFTRPMTAEAGEALESVLGPVPPTRYLHLAAPGPAVRLPSEEDTAVLRLRVFRLLRAFRLVEGRAAFVLEASGFAAAAYHAFGTSVLSVAGLRADHAVFRDVGEACLWLSNGDAGHAMDWTGLVARARLV